MQAIALRPQRGQIIGLTAGIALLTLAMAVCPALCLPLAWLMPLFACPLAGASRWGAALAAAAAAPLCALAYGQPLPYAACLLFPCGVPVAAAALLKPNKMAAPTDFLAFFAAYALAVAALLAFARGFFHGELSVGAAEWITQGVARSPNAGETLYRLAASGLISAPPGYWSQNPLARQLNPAYTRQLLLSLRLTTEIALRDGLPALIVQTVLLGGVFTTLRVQRLNHAYLLVDEKRKEQAKIAVVPGFSMLQLPTKAVRRLLGIAVAALLCSLVGGGWFDRLARLLFTSVACVFELLGAAVLVGTLARRFPRAKTALGVLAALLYALFPTALFLLGATDPLFHFRTRAQAQSKEEERQ